MANELNKAELIAKQEIAIPVFYEEIKFNCGYRIDILVNKKVIIELKVVENFTIEHIAQVLTYMRFANCKPGLLPNFYKKIIKGWNKKINFMDIKKVTPSFAKYFHKVSQSKY